MMSYRNTETVALAGAWSPHRDEDAIPASKIEPVILARLVLDLTPRRQRGRWAMQLDDAVAAAPERLVVVAHGLACAAFAFWAQLTPRQYLRTIAGALLIEPARPARTRAFSFMKSPKVRLPFPSLLLSIRREGPNQMQRELADNWGSELVTPDAVAGQAWPWLIHAAQLPLVAADA